MPAEAAGGTVELLVALKTVPPFASLPAEDLALLVERATLRTFQPGAVVIERGALVDAIHLLLEGTLLEERGGRTWARREPYEIVGGVDALAGASADVAVRAETAARTLELGREALLDVCYDRFDVLATVASGVAAMAIAARRLLGALPWEGSAASATMTDADVRTLDLAERVAFMRNIPVLENTAVLTLAGVAATSTPVVIGAGEPLWRVGDPADHVLLILSGAIDCADEGETRFALGPREVAGVLDALATSPRWYNATARTRVVALRSRMADVMDVLEDDPATAVAALTQLARATSNLVAAVPEAARQGALRA
jgi:CRP-like cAMP-binding protein